MKKVLITDYVHTSLLHGLYNKGYNVIYDPEISYHDVGKMCAELSGIIVNTRTPMRKEYIDRAIALEFIGRLGSGLDIIDVEYAESKGIYVISAPEGNANAVAEHAMAMILALTSKIIIADDIVSNFKWAREYCRGSELESKTIGIIGVGNNGTKFIEKLKPFTKNVLYFDKYRQRFPETIRYATESTLEELLKKSDIISLHIPLTEETDQMIDSAWLEKCKSGVIIVNTSRGRIVVIEDLIHAMENKKVGGACLDVLPVEKPELWSDTDRKNIKKLAQNEQVVLSPHVAGWTEESYKKIALVILEKLNKKFK